MISWKADNSLFSAYLLAIISVSLFGLTLPMTRIAVSGMDPILVGPGRALGAAFISIIILLFQKARWPKSHEIIPLIWVGLGVSVMFPFLSALAMRHMHASTGAIITGLLPLATAYVMTFERHEKPSPLFWVGASLGSGAIVIYIYLQHGLIFSWDIIWLLGAVFWGAIGYAKGAVLSREMGPSRVMCWALVLVSPILLLLTVPKLLTAWSMPSMKVILSFTYLMLISQLFGMMIWYKALSLASVARISQVQLLQPLMTVLFSFVLFNEPVSFWTWIAAVFVLLAVLISRLSPIQSN